LLLNGHERLASHTALAGKRLERHGRHPIESQRADPAAAAWNGVGRRRSEIVSAQGQEGGHKRP
ncbi:MAG: hypothetical protein WAL38_12105, partial [Solirubrobacteraceae bacterium]